MASMVLLRQGLIPKVCKLIQHPLHQLALAKDALAGFPSYWHGLARLGVPKFECISKVPDLWALVN
jgi:hypothetical protein